MRKWGMDIEENLIYSEIGSNIRSLRQKTGLSQAQLAREIGILRTSVTNIESGLQRPPLHLLYKFCLALNVEITAVLPTVEKFKANHLVSLTIDGEEKKLPAMTADFIERTLKE